VAEFVRIFGAQLSFQKGSKHMTVTAATVENVPFRQGEFGDSLLDADAA